MVAAGSTARGRRLPAFVPLRLLLLLLLLLRPSTATAATASSPAAAAKVGMPSTPPPTPTARPADALVLDVDGTLYDASTGLEAEIAARIKRYCNEVHGTTDEECDALHRRYGSTIEGLKQLHKLTDAELAAFYAAVYRGLPLHRLLRHGGGGDVLGYAHRVPLRELLSAHRGPVWVASNSPAFHVRAVLRHLGLAGFPFAGVLTPDYEGRGREDGGGYPTKTDPRFWEPLLNHHQQQQQHTKPPAGIVLLDDSEANLAAAASLGMRGIKVNGGAGGLPLERALAASVGAIDAAPFDDVAYIRAKNAVDARSFCPVTARRLGRELAALREKGQEQNGTVLRVKDLGAGLLSMLNPVLRMAGHAGWNDVVYEAYEVNPTLVAEARTALVAQGFREEEGGAVLVRGALAGKGEDGTSIPAARVRLLLQDFGGGSSSSSSSSSSGGQDEEPDAVRTPHLIVGCCLADLYQPEEFVARLLRVAVGGAPLVYLPITFVGRTCLCPPAPEEDEEESGRRLPADAVAMAEYHASLSETQGHSLDPTALIGTMERHGASLLAQGPSDWAVKRDRDPALWGCLVHFFGLGLLPRMGAKGWDIPAWRRRVLQRAPDIEVGNVDLLFRLSDEKEEKQQVVERKGGGKSVYVEFVGPRDVRCREEGWPPQGKERALGPMELEVEAVCSLISSGTELKVYRGDFDRESAVDVSIKGMAAERMDYPLRYGYSLVGRVVRCGTDVPNAHAFLRPDQLVFCFAPHASTVIVDASCAMLVPSGVEPEDAVYLPSVETALSLVQDARPVAGERVTVVGAGLIGLLVVSVLSRLPLTALRAVDPLPTRRALARLVGATEATDPAQLAKGDEQQAADTSIEVSGVAAGLQTALDHTGYGGRVIVGSWYGNHERPATLRVGLPFHRSHLRIQCSQVSRISTELQDRWSKTRRFGVAWDLVRRLRPSRALTTLVVPPERVGEAFAALDQKAAETLAVLIDYRERV